MNRRFGVPALAGSDRLKAGHQTNLATQSGSRSQCTAKKAAGAFHEPWATNPPLTPPRRGTDQASGSPPWRGWGWVDGPNAFEKNDRGLSMNRTSSARPLSLKAAEGRRTPKRWRVGQGHPNFRQVLECAAPAALWIFPEGSWSQCTTMPRGLSMNLGRFGVPPLGGMRVAETG